MSSFNLLSGLSPFHIGNTCSNVSFSLGKLNGVNVITYIDADGRTDIELVDTAARDNSDIYLDGLSFDLAAGVLTALNTKSDELSVIDRNGKIKRFSYNKPSHSGTSYTGIGADSYVNKQCNTVMLSTYSRKGKSWIQESILDWSKPNIQTNEVKIHDGGYHHLIYTDIVRNEDGRLFMLAFDDSSFKLSVVELYKKHASEYKVKKRVEVNNNTDSFIELGAYKSSGLTTDTCNGSECLIITKPGGKRYSFSVATFDKEKKKMLVDVKEDYNNMRYTSYDSASCKPLDVTTVTENGCRMPTDSTTEFITPGRDTTEFITPVIDPTDSPTPVIDPTDSTTEFITPGRDTTEFITPGRDTTEFITPVIDPTDSTTEFIPVTDTTELPTEFPTEETAPEVTTDEAATTDADSNCFFNVSARKVGVKIPVCPKKVVPETCKECKQCKRKCARRCHEKCLQRCNEEDGSCFECEEDCHSHCDCKGACKECVKDKKADNCNCTHRKHECGCSKRGKRSSKISRHWPRRFESRKSKYSQ